MDTVKVEEKVAKLRTMAHSGQGPTYEPSRLFHEIYGDQKCRNILLETSSAIKDEKVIEFYNMHIQRSKLSATEKKELII